VITALAGDEHIRLAQFIVSTVIANAIAGAICTPWKRQRRENEMGEQGAYPHRASFSISLTHSLTH
jgi:hypothetical protein